MAKRPSRFWAPLRRFFRLLAGTIRWRPWRGPKQARLLCEHMGPVYIKFGQIVASSLKEELDFRKEAANLEQFNQIMGRLGYADVRAPRPLAQLTTPRVLVMERFRGIRIDDLEKLRERPAVDPEERLIRGVRAWFQCVVFDGFFHGDVHAGNLMLLDDQ